MIRESPWLDPQRVRRGELLEAEHAPAPGGEVRRGGTAHAAEADDDDVGGAHASG